MGDVPALGQHTRALLVESGLDAAAADDLIGRGIALQPDWRCRYACSFRKTRAADCVARSIALGCT